MTTLGLIALLGVTLVPMLAEARSRRFDVFHPKNPFLLYVLVQIAGAWMAGRLLERAALSTGFDSPVAPVSHAGVFWCAAVGVAAFQIAFYGSSRWTDRLAVPREPVFAARRLDLALVVSVIVAAGGFAALVLGAGGVGAFVENRQTWRSEGVAGQGLFMFACTSVPVMTALVYWTGRTWRGKPLSWPGAMVLMGAALVPSIVIGFRSLMLLPVVQLLLLLVRAGKGARRWVIATGGVVVVVFTGYGVYRQWAEVVPEGASLREGVQLMFEQRPELFFDVLVRSRGADVVAVVMREVDLSHDYKLVVPALVEAATVLVPRAVWAGKGSGLSVEFSERFFLLSGGVSPTIIGEFYWHIGWIGVVLGMATWGVLASALGSVARRLPPRSHWMVLYSFAFVDFVMSAEIVQGYLNGLVLVGLAFAGLTAALGGCRRPADPAPAGAGPAAGGM